MYVDLASFSRIFLFANAGFKPFILQKNSKFNLIPCRVQKVGVDAPSKLISLIVAVLSQCFY
jgi:hypothetical protein